MAGASGQNDSYRTLLRGLKFLWSLERAQNRPANGNVWQRSHDDKP